MTTTITIVHSIDRHSTAPGRLEVYGSPEDGWYEYRVIGEAERILEDSGTQRSQYCSPTLALRDAINADIRLT